MVVWLPWHNYFWINTAPLIHPFNASRSSCLWRKAALIYRYENAMVRSETRLSSLNQMHILPMTILMRRQTIQVANIHPLSRPLGQALKSPFNAQAHCCGEIHNKNNTWQALFGSQFEKSWQPITVEKSWQQKPMAVGHRACSVGKEKGGLACSLCNPRTQIMEWCCPHLGAEGEFPTSVSLP